MSDTTNFELPLLAAAQAQKHVTMNEALTRVDALAAPSALSADLGDPPLTAALGDAYVVAVPASGVWSGRETQLAFRANDGWSFAAPRPGWRVWVADRGLALLWTGSAWVEAAEGPVVSGAQTSFRLSIADEPFQAGASFLTGLAIPDRAVVLGVTARVLSDATGAGLASWRLGVAGGEDRYGSGIGVQAGSFGNGVTGSPVAYYADTPLRIEAEGGDFDGGGVVRIALHFLSLTPPDVI